MKNVRRLVLCLLSLVFVIACFTACDGFFKGTNEDCVHEWTDATCTEAKHCTKCEATEGEALGHDFANATCTAPKTCKTCGTTEGEKANHVGGTATCEKEAVCESCGNTYGEKAKHDFTDATCTTPKTCKVCGTTEGEKANHVGGTADCKNEAVCEICGESYGEKGGHDFADATCTTPKTCKICGATDGEKLGHSGGSATCEKEAVCEVCGEPYGEKANHVYTEKKIGTIYSASVATCDNAATYYYSCVCGAIGDETFEDGEALGHDYRYVCGENGTHIKYCANESDVTGGATEQCSGGSATCTDEAVCTFCAHEYGEALGHSWGEGVTDAATCIADGKTVYTCSSCGETKTDVIKAPGHSYKATETVAAGCTTVGYTVYTCSGCNDSYHADEVEAQGHSWSGERTCESGRECNNCDATEDALGHSYVKTTTPAPVLPLQ